MPEAYAYCPNTLPAYERQRCLVEESEAWAQQQNDTQNQRTQMEDMLRNQQAQQHSRQQWQQQHPQGLVIPDMLRRR